MPRAFSAELKKQWKDNILNQRESGLSVAAWCRKKSINSHTFRYWENKLLPKNPLDRSSFTELPQDQINSSQSDESTIQIDIQRIRIHLNPKDKNLELNEFLNKLKGWLC